MSRGDDIVAYLLGRGMYADQVRDLASNLGISGSGPKDEVIERILSKSHPRPVDVLSYVDVPGLRDCCEEFGLDSSGSRDILVDRLSTYVRRSWGIPKRRGKAASGTPSSPRLPIADQNQALVGREIGSRSFTALLSVIGIVGAALVIYFYSSYGGLGLLIATAVAVVAVLVALLLWPHKSR